MAQTLYDLVLLFIGLVIGYAEAGWTGVAMLSVVILLLGWLDHCTSKRNGPST